MMVHLRWFFSPFLMALAFVAHAGGAAPAAIDVAQWMERMRQASQQRSFTGTFVVLSANGQMSSSRIWNASDGHQRIERVDALSGTPRTVFRSNEEVRTFLPQTHVMRLERREHGDAPGGRFPAIAQHSAGVDLSRFYVARPLPAERVAGLEADGVWLQPLDGLRFGYRIWSERSTGLAVKLQTLSADGRVLEQAAFSQLDLQTPVLFKPLSQAMDTTTGYRVLPVAYTPTTAAAEGWALHEPVSGFTPVSCYRRPSVSGVPESSTMLQCIYSDGLATVSLFAERFDPKRHPATTQQASLGATHLLGLRVGQDMWLTAVGEVPAQTLQQFARQFQRIR